MNKMTVETVLNASSIFKEKLGYSPHMMSMSQEAWENLEKDIENSELTVSGGEEAELPEGAKAVVGGVYIFVDGWEARKYMHESPNVTCYDSHCKGNCNG